MKILIIQQKMIGDVLTSSILFEVLRKEFPEARLEYLIYKHTFPVVENNPFIDELIPSEKEDLKPHKFPAFLQRIRKRKYNIIIDVYSKIGTALLCAYSGANTTISYEKWYTKNFYFRVVKRAETPLTPAGLAIENRLRLLTPLIEKGPAQIKPKIYLTTTETTAAKNRLEQAGISGKEMLLMVSVLGSSEAKTYPLPYLATLLDETVEETGAHLLFNYIPKQLPEAQQVFELCNTETKEHIHLEIFGRSLREFMSLTSHCDAIIGNEGGAINMAKALEVPAFAIFSPSINKEDWALFENKATNTSVHLKDFRPGLFEKGSTKKLKKDSEKLYDLFKPEMIWPELKEFLQSIETNKKNSH
ncbi:glycosyltransferase family 9 protein [Antarcticibacterium flavum]|uniref:Glycosyltransferase family 9 protein n=1 Tax=Antarcticibacterium flavum TaxID=2058175 RepID=A0A5B7X775_9FLAO|nr:MULTISPECIES: glycosyltransferase family 9 protein [Antarcticibacterium]MCM4159356.1 glycosyltransferase [Antarcticibacterium sp. W02-3]QCY70940.1 glycosyltransferase family 9 protein [Antarcticibacterium flavum]